MNCPFLLALRVQFQEMWGERERIQGETTTQEEKGNGTRQARMGNGNKPRPKGKYPGTPTHAVAQNAVLDILWLLTYIEDALRGRTAARPPLVNDSLLRINALGRCGPISLADFGILTWLEAGCLEPVWKHLGGKAGLS